MLTEITDLPDDDLIHSMNTAHRTLTRHQARFIVSLAEFHDRALAKRSGAPNTVTWLMQHHDLARRTAFEYLGVGRRLREFPLVAGEFLAGTLSYSKVRFLLRYVTAGNEDELVELALRHCLSELEQALAGRLRTGAASREVIPSLSSRTRKPANSGSRVPSTPNAVLNSLRP